MLIKNGLVALAGEGDFRRSSIRVRAERIAEIDATVAIIRARSQTAIAS